MRAVRLTCSPATGWGRSRNSVKWVGLFTIAWVGLYTLADLWALLGERQQSLVRMMRDGNAAARADNATAQWGS